MAPRPMMFRSEEHTSELQSRVDLVCRLLLEKKKLPPAQNMYRPEKVTIHQVLSGNAMWNPRKESDILLLGDSFSNIFSLDALGWGESAGLAEHLSRALGGRSLDFFFF